MKGDAMAQIAEDAREVDAACLPSFDFLLEDDADLERQFAPGTARALDAYLASAPLYVELDPDPQCAAQTREAITRLIDPSGDQGGPHEEDR